MWTNAVQVYVVNKCVKILLVAMYVVAARVIPNNQTDHVKVNVKNNFTHL